MFKKLSAQRSSAPERLSAEAGAHTFHILNSNGVCFLTLAERSYPKKLAFQYLEELSNEFNRLYGGQQVDSVSRPYAFIKFGASQHLTQCRIQIVLSDGLGRCPYGYGDSRLPCFLCCHAWKMWDVVFRHIYSEDQEAVLGHPDTAEYHQTAD